MGKEMKQALILILSIALTAPALARGVQQEGRPPRTSVPQPQQKQSLEYFVGEWKSKWMGRESAFGAGGRQERVTTFKLAVDGKTLESKTESDDRGYRESSQITFDEASKILSFAERRGDLKITSKGDWTSPLAIRFTIDPIKVRNRTLQLKRTITIISAFSFSMVEELSEDGGPFVRLGQATFSKVITP